MSKLIGCIKDLIGWNTDKKKGEGTKFHVCRFATIAIFLLLFILYFVYLIYTTVKDVPTLVITRDFVNEIYVPDIEMCATSQTFNLLRCDFSWANKTKTSYNNCSEYLLPNTRDYGLFGQYCLTFKTDRNIMFSNPEKPVVNGLQKIGFFFYENTTSAEAGTLGIASLTIQLTPPDHDLLLNPNLAISEADKASLDELTQQMNFIAGMTGYAAVVKFQTSAYKSILPGDSKAIFGFDPKYHETPSIQNFINYFPLNNNITGDGAPVGTTGYFSIAAGSFIREVTSEKRNATVLGLIGLAGGALGIMGAAIVFLFGDPRLSPLGRLHMFMDRLKYGHEKVTQEENENENGDEKKKRKDIINEYKNLGKIQLIKDSKNNVNMDQQIGLINEEFKKIKRMLDNFLVEVV